MTLMEDDLLAALKVLHETSIAMTNGRLHSAEDMERFHRSLDWAKRVIALAESDK